MSVFRSVSRHTHIVVIDSTLRALVDAAARGIAGSDLTILDGTQGVNEVVAGLVGQGLFILEVLKKATATGATGSAPVPTAEAGKWHIDKS